MCFVILGVKLIVSHVTSPGTGRDVVMDGPTIGSGRHISPSPAARMCRSDAQISGNLPGDATLCRVIIAVIAEKAF